MIQTYCWRLFLNGALFFCPLVVWLIFDYGNYGGLWSWLPAAVRCKAVLVCPVLLQYACLAVAYPYGRLRPLVYGAALPALYVNGLTLYRLSVSLYVSLVKVLPSLQDAITQKWVKGQKALTVIGLFPVDDFAVACLCLVASRYAIEVMWKKIDKPSLFINWHESKMLSADTTTHGSAQLCSPKRMRLLHQDQGLPIGTLAPRGWYDNPLLSSQESSRPISKSPILRLPFHHSLVIAPSGAGKGLGIIIPTLLDYQGSVLVTDIKGENYQVTAAYRRSQGRNIYAVDPFALTGDQSSVCFNVFDLLTAEDSGVVEDTATLANLLSPVPKEGSANAAYFARQAAAVLQCLILYVLCDRTFGLQHKNLGTVYDLLCQAPKALKQLLETLSEHHAEMAFGTVARLANRVLATHAEELSGTLNTACAQLRFLESPEVRACLQTSLLDLEEVVQGQADLYLCIPSEKIEVQSHLLRLLTGVVFLKLQQARGQRKGPPVLFVLDEMPALGYMPQIEQALVYGRGYGVRLLAISQTLEKLRAVYPDSWRTFLSSDVCVFFGAREPEAAEYVSKRLGTKTVLSFAESISYSQSRREKGRPLASSASSAEQKGSSLSETRRPLLSVDEVARLPSSVLIAFVAGEAPLLLQRLNYLTHPHYKGKYQKNRLHLNNA